MIVQAVDAHRDYAKAVAKDRFFKVGSVGIRPRIDHIKLDEHT
jgi:hypothetical protein